MTNCLGCDAEWGGLLTCHCAACHQTFAGITAFDMHRTGSHTKSKRTCVLPPEAGLRLTKREYPCWGSPRDEEAA